MKNLVNILIAMLAFPILMGLTYAMLIMSYLITPFIIAVFVLAFLFAALGGLDRIGED